MTEIKLFNKINKLLDQGSFTTTKIQRIFEVDYATASLIMDSLVNEGLVLEFDRKVKIIKKGKEDQIQKVIFETFNQCCSGQENFELKNANSGNAKTLAELNQYSDVEIIKQLLPKMIQKGCVSAAYIQRMFSVGYARAAKIMDFLLSSGIVKRMETKIVCVMKENEIDNFIKNINKLCV